MTCLRPKDAPLGWSDFCVVATIFPGQRGILTSRHQSRHPQHRWIRAQQAPDTRPSSAPTSRSSWKTIAQDVTVDVYAGGGSGKRGVVRTPCKTTASRYCRTVTDVDIDWAIDTPEKEYSKEVSLQCTA